MALEDWDVEIHDVVARKNTAKNPYTQLPIDPDGLTLSLFTMTLTHRPTGKTLSRADLMSSVDAEALKRYARDVIAVADASLAVQKQTDAQGNVIAPSPLVGALSLVLPVASEPSREQKDAEVLQRAQAIKTRLEAIAADDTEAIARAQAVVTAKAQPVKDAEVLRLKEQLAAIEIAAAALADSPDVAVTP